MRRCLADVRPNVRLFFRPHDISLFELAREYFSVWQGQCPFEWAQRIENECGMLVLMCLFAWAVTIVENSNAIVFQHDSIFVSIGFYRILREYGRRKHGRSYENQDA